MQKWQDSDRRECPLIQGEEEIMRQITGTVRDNISNMLSERGIARSPRQVINKTKQKIKNIYLAIALANH